MASEAGFHHLYSLSLFESFNLLSVLSSSQFLYPLKSAKYQLILNLVIYKSVLIK